MHRQEMGGNSSVNSVAVIFGKKNCVGKNLKIKELKPIYPRLCFLVYL